MRPLRTCQELGELLEAQSSSLPPLPLPHGAHEGSRSGSRARCPLSAPSWHPRTPLAPPVRACQGQSLPRGSPAPCRFPSPQKGKPNPSPSQQPGARRSPPALAPPPPSPALAAAPPPVLVAVPRGNKKRKHAEAEKASEDQSSSNKQEPPVKVKKTGKKELSKAGKKLANRESALEQADEEEEQKLFQSKAKRTSRAIAKSGVNSETLKQQKKKNEAEEMIKNKRTVFVGNLPVNSTAQMLKSLFKEYGQIESIRFRSVVPAEDTLSKKLAAIKRKIHPNVKYINAYVVFKEECDAIKALKKNGTEIASGFHIRVDIASKNSSHDNKRSVFLGNLSYDVSDDAVREHFADCGDVVAVRIVRDRQTGMGKGFGYILFETTDAVHLALKLNDSALQGRKVRVQRCVEKGSAARRAAGQPRGPRGRARSAAPTGSVHSASFVGEKAAPCARGAKTKRLRKGAAKRKPGKQK